jgi:hypothetical protein
MGDADQQGDGQQQKQHQAPSVHGKAERPHFHGHLHRQCKQKRTTHATANPDQKFGGCGGLFGQIGIILASGRAGACLLHTPPPAFA